MRALVLPTNDLRVAAMEALLSGKGHSSVCVDTKADFIKELGDCDVVVAMGELTPLGIWLWGYTAGRCRRIRAMKGIVPCLVTKTIILEKWLEGIPEQTSLAF